MIFINKIKKISTKITTILSIIILIIISAISAIAYKSSKEKIENEMNDKLGLILHAVNESIGLYIENSEIILKTLCKDKEISKITNELYNGNRENLSQITERFKTIVDNNEGIISIYLGIGERDILYYPKRDVFMTYKNTDEEWYKKTLENKGLTHSEPYNIGKKSIITISYPVLYNDKILGAIAIDVDFKYIASKIGEFKVDNQEIIGIIIERDRKFIFQYINNEKLKSKIQEKYISGEEALLTTNILLPDLADYLNDNDTLKEERIVKLNIDNQEYICKVKKDNQYKWYTILGVDKTNFMEGTELLLKDIITAGIVISILGIIIIAKIISKIGDNINSLRNVVEKVGEGNLQVRCNTNIISRNDELGELANGIDCMIYQQSQMFESISNMMLTDSLTMLKNRRAVNEYINELKNKSNFNVSIMMLDIDYFKLYNDNYGHIKGDNILQEFSKVLRENVDLSNQFPNKIIARYGGEEFLVIIEDCNQNDIMNIANDVKQALATKQIEHKYSLVANYITSSIGLASNIDNDIDISELIECADKALYKSKESGRNRYTHYNNIEK